MSGQVAITTAVLGSNRENERAHVELVPAERIVVKNGAAVETALVQMKQVWKCHYEYIYNLNRCTCALQWKLKSGPYPITLFQQKLQTHFDNSLT